MGCYGQRRNGRKRICGFDPISSVFSRFRVRIALSKERNINYII